MFKQPSLRADLGVLIAADNKVMGLLDSSLPSSQAVILAAPRFQGRTLLSGVLHVASLCASVDGSH